MHAGGHRIDGQNELVPTMVGEERGVVDKTERAGARRQRTEVALDQSELACPLLARRHRVRKAPLERSQERREKGFRPTMPKTKETRSCSGSTERIMV